MGRRLVLAGLILGMLMTVTGLLAVGPEVAAQTAGGAGAGACVDDAYEENDTQATASPLPGEEAAGARPDLPAGFMIIGEPLRSCPGDDDWFSVPLIRGQEAQIDVAFQHAEGDIDIYLVDPIGLGVASSLSVTDDEKIRYTADFTGEYALLVEILSDTGAVTGNDYVLAADRYLSAGDQGDSNCDAVINAVDAALVLQLVAGLVPSLPCEAAGDIDRNGFITAIDALIILQLDAGLIGL